jgi:hypothetical protein
MHTALGLYGVNLQDFSYRFGKIGNEDEDDAG